MDTNQVFNKINEILSDAMGNVVTEEEMKYNANAQKSCANEIEECYQILKNADLSSSSNSSSSSFAQGNIDMAKIKTTIEKCIKENSNNLGDGHVNKRLNNIDEKLDELATKITGHPMTSHNHITTQDNTTHENNKSELEKMRNDMLEEFREIKDKMIEVLDKKQQNNNSTEREKEREVTYTTNAIKEKEPSKYQDLLNETALLKDKFENFANKADYTNHTNDLILQRMSLLNEKINQQQSLPNMNTYGSPSSQQLGLSINDISNPNLNSNSNINSNSNLNSNPSVMNKLKEEIEKIIETTQEKKKKKEKIDDKIKEKDDIDKEEDEEENNDKDEEKNKKQVKEETKTPEKQLKELKKNNKFVFTKTKDPFKHIYNNTDGEVFKKIDMSGGGEVTSKLNKLKEMRKNAIKRNILKINT